MFLPVVEKNQDELTIIILYRGRFSGPISANSPKNAKVKPTVNFLIKLKITRFLNKKFSAILGPHCIQPASEKERSPRFILSTSLPQVPSWKIVPYPSRGRTEKEEGLRFRKNYQLFNNPPLISVKLRVGANVSFHFSSVPLWKPGIQLLIPSRQNYCSTFFIFCFEEFEGA